MRKVFYIITLLLGVGLSAQAVQFMPNPVDFGNVQVNQMSEAFIDIMEIDPATNPNANAIVSATIINDSEGVYNVGNQFFNPGFGGGNIGVGINPTTVGTTYTATLQVVMDETNGNETYLIPLSATAVPAMFAEIAVNALNFATIQVNTTATQNLQIFNNGNIDLEISGISIDTSNDNSFTVTVAPTPGNPIVITPNTSTTIAVTYSPTPLVGGNTVDEFNRATTITFQSNDTNNFETDVNLSGSVFASNPQSENTDFDDVEIGQTVSQSNTLTNNGQGILFIDSISFGEFNTGSESLDDYEIATTLSFPIELAQGESLTVDINFTANRLSFSRVFMSYNVRNHTSANVSLTLEANGVQSEISFPTEINLGNTRVGETTTQTLTISNSGGLPTEVSALEIKGTNASQFSFTDASAQTIAAGGSVDYELNFESDVVGGKTAQISFTSNAESSPHSISILANSTNSALQVMPGDITFDEVLLGESSSPQTITLSNEFGSDAVTISNIESLSTNFTLSGVSTPLTIAAGSTSTINVSATPQQIGSLQAPIIIESNDDNNIISIDITGSGVSPEIELGRTQMFFFNTAFNSNGRTELLTVKNNGTGVLTLDSAVIENSPGSPIGATSFQVSDSVIFPLDIAPNEMALIPVKFTPQFINGSIANLRLNTTDGNFNIFLSGTGSAPSGQIDKDAEFPNQMRIGETETRTFTITNSGVGTLVISDFNLEELGPDADTEADFSVDITTPYSVLEGQTRTVTITATPLSKGFKKVKLNLTTNSTTNAILGERLEWLYDVPELAFVDIPDSFIMNETVINETSYTPITIANDGLAPLLISGESNTFFQTGGQFSIPENSDLPPEFSSFNNFPLTINVGDSKEILVQFMPFNNTSLGQIALETGLIFNNDEVGGYSNSVELTVYGGALIPELSIVDAEPILFDETSINRFKESSVTVQNTGTANLVINNVVGDGTFGFTNADDFVTTTIGVGKTKKFDIIFTPNAIGTIDGFISFETNLPGNFRSVDTRGIGIEPAEVMVNGLTFKSDKITGLGGGLLILSGNVHTGKMDFDNDVTVNLNNNSVNCNCRVFASDIAEVGDYGGDEVSLMEGNVNFTVEQDADNTPIINAALGAGTTAVSSFFELVGIPIEFSKFEIISGDDPGIEVGGSIELPSEVFGPEVKVEIDRLRIVESGVNIEGTSSITGDPAVRILKTFELEEAAVNFNTFENTFGGSATVKLALLKRSITISANASIINGGLEAVGLTVGFDPGIPLGATGWRLTEGSGSISGIQIPPLTIGVSVDLVPSQPIDILKLNDMGVTYKFGTSLEASGSIEILDQEVGGGSILVNSMGVNASAYVNLYNVFRGDVSFLVEKRGDRVFAEAQADLTLTIPKLPAVDCGICETANTFLPFTVAELKAKINNDGFEASTKIAKILKLDVKLEFGGKLKVGGNFADIPFSFGRKLPDGSYFENNDILKRQSRFEGGSLVVPVAKNAVAQVPFNLSQSYENVIVRIEGPSAFPEATLTLPNGTVLTPTSAVANGTLYTESDENPRVFYIMKDTQVGAYLIDINGAGPFEIDLFGAEFAPEIEITSVNFDNTTKDLVINWNDQDLDSDATVSLYYDIDGKDANGCQIATGISEDDAANTFSFNAANLMSGTYHVYAKIEDDTNVAVYSYAVDTFTVTNTSPVETPILIGELVDNIFEMSWTPIKGADHYVMYIDNESVTFFSDSRSVGSGTAFDFEEIEPGRTYKFAISAMQEELDGTFTESNLSNMLEFEFTSPDKNNTPMLETTALPNVTDPCATYTFDITYSDLDTEDVLTLTMPTSPIGMTLNSDTINWKPTADQIGKHQVILRVTDNNGSFNEKSFVITVMEADTAPTPDVETLPELTADCIVTITDKPTATDECDGAITATTTDAMTYDTPGTYNVTWTFEDATGNAQTQVQRVVVTDTDLPTPVCKNISVVLDETTNSVTILPADVDDGTTDNCSDTTDLILSLSQDTFTDEGDYPVTFTVEDEAGNIAACQTIVNIKRALSTEDFDEDLENVKLFPNPNSEGKVYLLIPNNITIEAIEVYDIVGRNILNINQVQEYINIKDFTTGMYIFKIYSKKGATVKQFIKK